VKCLNVLLISPSSGLGGAERVMLELLDGLDASMFRAVAVIPGNGPLHDALRLRQIPTYLGDARWWLPLNGAQSYFRYYCEDIPDLINPILKIIREHQIDIVYSCNSLILHGALAALIARRPHVHHVHELLGRSRAVLTMPFGSPWLAYAILGLLSSTVVILGRASRADIGTAIRGRRCRLVRNGVSVDAEAFSRSVDLVPARSDGTIRIGIVGVVQTQKGSDIIAPVVKRVCTDLPEAHFYWAGSGSPQLLDSLSKGAEINGARHLHFLGHVHDVPAFMNSIDLLLHPSKHDTFPRVLLEAAIMGRPAVATRCGGPEEIIEDGTTGLLAPVDDVEGISSAIVRLASDSQLRQHMGAAARRAALRYDLGIFQNAMRDTLIEAYRNGPTLRSALAAHIVSRLLGAPARVSRLIGRTRALRLLRASGRLLRRAAGDVGQR